MPIFVSLLAVAATLTPPMLGHHPAVYDRSGDLVSWTSWPDALAREMRWYERCPLEHGYPKFTTLTFMDGAYKATSRTDCIPAMQNGVGILSYLKYYEFTGRKQPKVLDFARRMGDYIVEQALTPDSGAWPQFPRSTGRTGQWPLQPDCGSQDDLPYEVQPDKGAIAGYALAELFRATHDARFRDEALHIGQILVRNQREGDATHSPWPYRVDFRTGAPRNEVAGNSAFYLRLFDDLIALGHPEFREPRARVWNWIAKYQIPSAKGDGMLFAQFFEDHHNDNNRTAWGPLNLARYLIEKKGAVDVHWQQDAKTLIDFVNANFTRVRFGIAICGEQDEDHDPWGGINSTWGAVLALYSRATGSHEYERLAHQVLTLCVYAIAPNGCPRDSLHNPEDGGWQEDAHTDKIHNFVDALRAFPEWGQYSSRQMPGK